jgi:nucleotide-binding universal stress UspA family protein
MNPISLLRGGFRMVRLPHPRSAGFRARFDLMQLHLARVRAAGHDGGMERTFHCILAATDFSEASQPALDEACRIAAACGARFLLVHVYQISPVAYISYAPPSVYEDYKRAVRTDAEKRLGDLVAQARSRGVDASGLLREGFPDEEEKADLIVMGTHGRRGPSRLILGSIAARVIARCSCPVLTVRAAREGSGQQASTETP